MIKLIGFRRSILSFRLISNNFIKGKKAALAEQEIKRNLRELHKANTQKTEDKAIEQIYRH